MSSSDCLPFNLTTLDCRNSTGWCLRPYGDVSGYGVVVGFKGTGYYVVFLLVVYYLTAFDPLRNPFEPLAEGTASTAHTWWEPNPIDIMILDLARRNSVSRWLEAHCPHLGEFFVSSILQLCDIQAFTGIAILISGFISLYSGISAYHWQMIASLAWFSSITHLSGLTVLRDRHHTRRQDRTVRMVLMFVLLVLLLVATIPTGYFSWGDTQLQGLSSEEKHAFMSSPAICYLRPNSGTWELWSWAAGRSSVTETRAFQSMVMSTSLLLVGFAMRSMKMSRGLSQRVTTIIRRPFSHYSERILVAISASKKAPKKGRCQQGQWQRMWHVIIIQPCLAVLISIKIIADIYNSLAAEIFWLLLAIAWGTLKLKAAAAELPPEIFEQENAWTFGQIVPVLLLAVPIFATISHFASNRTTSDSSDRQASDVSNTPTCRPYSFSTECPEPPEILSTNYTSRARWLWPCFLGLFMSATCFTYEAFSHTFAVMVPSKPYSSLVEIWFTDFGLLWYIIFGLPCAFTSTVAIGLALDPWFESSRKLLIYAKVALYQFLVLLPIMVFAASWIILDIFGFELGLFKGLYTSDSGFDKIILHIVTCVFMALLYYGFYLSVAILAGLFTRKGVRDGIS